jgi:hypothetical protein
MAEREVGVEELIDRFYFITLYVLHLSQYDVVTSSIDMGISMVSQDYQGGEKIFCTEVKFAQKKWKLNLKMRFKGSTNSYAYENA